MEIRPGILGAPGSHFVQEDQGAALVQMLMVFLRANPSKHVSETHSGIGVASGPWRGERSR